MASVFSRPLVGLNPSTRKLFAYLAGLAAVGVALRAAGDGASKSRSALPAAAAEQVQAHLASQAQTSKRQRPGVNMQFLKQLTHILRICIPGVFTPEAFWAALATCEECCGCAIKCLDDA
jgi:hypothetical protein